MMTRTKIGLQWKVFLTIVIVGILPLVAGLFLAWFYGRSALINASGEKFMELSKQLGGQIDFLIHREIDEAQSLTLSENLLETVRQSNRNRKEALDFRKSSQNPFSDSNWLLRNSVSKHFQTYLKMKQNEYEVIFLTDRFGRVVASSGPLEQTDYAEETWWKQTLNDGRGAVYVRGLFNQLSENPLRVDLGLPILDRDQRAIGALKLVIKDLGIPKILEKVKIGRTGHAMLLGENGRVLFCPLLAPEAHRPFKISNPKPRWFMDENLNTGWLMEENGHGSGETVLAFSLAPLTVQSTLQNSSFRPRLVITQEPDEIFAPIHQAFWAFSSLGIALIGVLTLLGVCAGKKLIRPILALQQGAEMLAMGNLGYRLRIQTHDELEILAETINAMAENLQQKTFDLSAARDYMKNIVEQSAALIITCGAAYEIREFNRGAEEILNASRNLMVGKDIKMIWDDPDEFDQIMTQVHIEGRRVHCQTNFARMDGVSVPVICSVTQLTDQRGQPQDILVVGEDITERKLLAESRLKAERLMALHRISTLLTHDLRSPMVGILKGLTLFQERYGKMPEDRAQQLLSDLVRGGDILLGTLNDLLDVYRHSLADLPLRYTRFCLSDVIDEVARLLEADAQTRGIKLIRERVSSDLFLTADRRRVQRVLFNLFDNAIKYSPSEGRVHLRADTIEKSEIRFQIEDQGPGIPEEEISKIFEFLYEGSSQNGIEQRGFGVGLYFCKVTVEAHGGRIWAENRLGGGAAFTVCLPSSNKTPEKKGTLLGESLS